MKQKKPENPYLNILCNLVLPSLLLLKGESWFQFSPLKALILALLFPLSYGVFDLIRRKSWNFLSILGLISILLTGGIGLLTLPTGWVAIKEAAIPLIIAFIVLGSLKTRYPLVKTFLFNEQFIAVHEIEAKLTSLESKKELESLLRRSTIALAFSFFVSAVLNFILAKWIVTSEAGTQAFTEELGKMTLWSYPVILLPSMIMLVGIFWWLLKHLSKLSGMPIESLFVDPKGHAPKKLP